MKKFLLAGLMVTGVATAATASDVKVCVEGAYPPFSSITSTGELVGFDIDITNALCDKMGKSCELVQSDWDGIIPALMSRKCDAILASMAITEARSQVVDFTTSYYNSPINFLAKKGTSEDVSPEALAGKVVGVQRGTIHHDFVAGEYPDVQLSLYGTQNELYLDLISGRVDYGMTDGLSAATGFLDTEEGADFAAVGPNLLDIKYHGEGTGIAVRKGEQDLIDALNEALYAIRADGTYKELNDKYFPIDIWDEINSPTS